MKLVLLLRISSPIYVIILRQFSLAIRRGTCTKTSFYQNILPHCQTPDPERREIILNEPQLLKTSSEAKSSPGVNRDSGIFEDLFSLHLKDNISLDRNSPTQDYFSYDQSPNHSCGAADE
ncbi:hypothetical protein Anas_09528, partial [Armadillidium nasatum]